ncbi:ferredoxin [Paracoccus seriniphilus]|uniref:ferredoxin n=1 Tax=Paracoccus seriniphilus TaxID=184748 RepID=UPI003569AD7B
MNSDSPPALTPPRGLRIAGQAPLATGSVLLLSPDEPDFWHVFRASDEFSDGRPDPMDRWSRRVIDAWAISLAAKTAYPSDGPPYPPFMKWARASGTCWTSRVGMLVHRDMGLFISFRGAVILDSPCPAPVPQASPCDACPAPCLQACPAKAFRAGYDPDACHRFLDQKAGADCMNSGCRVRRACPTGNGCGRLLEQSAWHMRQFHK